MEEVKVPELEIVDRVYEWMEEPAATDCGWLPIPDDAPFSLLLLSCDETIDMEKTVPLPRSAPIAVSTPQRVHWEDESSLVDTSISDCESEDDGRPQVGMKKPISVSTIAAERKKIRRKSRAAAERARLASNLGPAWTIPSSWRTISQ
jgi:hypothetical protein